MFTPAIEDRLMTIPEVAATLRVAVTTVTIWCKRGRIPAAKIGKSYRIRQGDLQSWFEGKRVAI